MPELYIHNSSPNPSVDAGERNIVNIFTQEETDVSAQVPTVESQADVVCVPVELTGQRCFKGLNDLPKVVQEAIWQDENLGGPTFQPVLLPLL